jgi:hypothetical protein
MSQTLHVAEFFQIFETLPLLESLHGVGISSWRWNLFMALESLHGVGTFHGVRTFMASEGF